jgi:hypothetical protein
MRYLLALLLLLAPAGCMTGTTAEDGQITTRNLGHNTAVLTEQSIVAGGLDQPYTLWTDADQHTVTGPLAETAMTLSLPNGLALHLSSPKDGTIGALVVTFTETGEIASVTVNDLTYSISDPTAARAAVIGLLVDYAKQMSADRRAEFIAFMSTVDNALAAAIKAALP